ncbi:hypothetical protein V499_00872 [Pseudogymnoascus sp. VKM F-103]|uniref:N-acetyltransferase domain-containing protein n=1 Tax=Pseudogymnoascus verrucosus TaxID=342668 RepID=A0A1B8G959_9PEZI|nr:uncharacterized protein VE01_09370 [Pseudogymnoascus verrucosus]KFY80244.1 hypothetical protein V499_00872 [Pseudogymnoascus sp. VKM F-103]OBT92364.1 hypothetical protein VE01_09370 [Pseudogymnoascus verrucosus]
MSDPHAHKDDQSLSPHKEHANLPRGYRILAGHPSIPEYLALRRQAGGLSPKTAIQAEKAMGGSWYAAYIVSTKANPDATQHLNESQADLMNRNEGETAVAMARVIGDGGWYFHIIDFAVLPKHQRKGLGQALMADILNRIRKEAPPGAYVNLIANDKGQALYGKFGFKEPVGDLGMELRMEYPEGAGPDDEKIPRVDETRAG